MPHAATTLPALRAKALRLSKASRIRLMNDLAESVFDAEAPVTGQELDARMAAYESGRDKGTPASKVFATARKRLGLSARK
jgi:putative addiction module component (TIGR02574 family)